MAAMCALAAIVLGACSGGPGADDVTPDGVPAPATDPFGATDTTRGSATDPSTDNSLIEAADGPIVVAAIEGVLGWWDGSGWVAPTTPPPLEAGAGFQILEIGRQTESRTAGEIGIGCEFVEASHGVDLGFVLPETWPSPMPIGVTPPPWDLVPHPVEPLEVIPGDDIAYTAGVLAELGIADANPEIVQEVRTDLDGDGTEEVLIVAERMSTGFLYPAADGDYSVALVRRTSGGATVTAVLGEALIATTDTEEPPILFAFRFAALADLNGDGNMEIVLDTQYHEGSSVEVFEYTESGPMFAIGADCGV